MGGTDPAARDAACKSNLRQFGQGFHTFAEQHREAFNTGSFDWLQDGSITEIGWVADLVKLKFTPGKQLCPSNPAQGADALEQALALNTTSGVFTAAATCVDVYGPPPRKAPDGTLVWMVRNVGDAPLALQVGPTSCKCTVAGLDKNEILPGEQATVQLQWTTGRLPLYSHYATIYTNDPARRSFDLTVHGNVRMLFESDVSEIVFPEMLPGEPAVAEVLLYSQVWDSLTIEHLDSPLPGLQWEVAAVEPASSTMKDAKCVRRLRLTIPEGLPAGELASTIHLTLVGSDDTKKHLLEIPLYATVQPRISLIGGDTD